MDFKSFIHCVQQEVQKQYPDAEVIINKVRKNNGKVLDTLSINGNQERIVPCIYLNPYYILYQEGTPMDVIINEILENHQSAKQNSKLASTENAMLQKFSDFNAVKDHIVFKVINQERNQELLNSVPYKKFLDLAIVYMILVKEDDDVIGTILIDNDHLKLWKEDVDVDIDMLHSYAMKNTPLLLPVKIESMESVLRNLVCEPDRVTEKEDEISELYVISNRKGINGASTILYPDVIKDFRNRVCQTIDKIYILPSSIHESILFLCSDGMESEYLQEMVRDINRTEVMEEEVLSDNVYIYDAIQDKIFLVSEYEKGETIQ